MRSDTNEIEDGGPSSNFHCHCLARVPELVIVLAETVQEIKRLELTGQYIRVSFLGKPHP